MTAPYYADEWVTLYHGRNEDMLPDLGMTFDLIVADPPYGETSLEWDRWPVGWVERMTAYSRSMWCFGSFRMFMDRRDEFAAWKLSQDVVWHKHRPTTVVTDRFARQHEHATHWYVGPWGEIHRDTPKVPHYRPRGPRRSRTTAVEANVRGTLGAAGVWEDDGTRWQPTVIEASGVHRNDTINETEKPVGLLTPLISYACPPGGTVLDPFGGSASTAVAARSLGCKTVLIERRESQCEAAAKRLSQGVLDFGASA